MTGFLHAIRERGAVTFLRSLWLDGVIGWSEGRELVALHRARKFRHRRVRAKAAWNELNPHPFNCIPCLVHMEPDVDCCHACVTDRKAVS